MFGFFPEVRASCLSLFFFLLGKYTFFIVYCFSSVALAPLPLCLFFLNQEASVLAHTTETVLWEEKLNEGRFVGQGTGESEGDEEGVWGVFVNNSLFVFVCLPHRARHALRDARCK